MINPYWALYARIFKLTICRSCGAVLDKDYKKRRRGKLCMICNLKEGAYYKSLQGIDIDTSYLE